MSSETRSVGDGGDEAFAAREKLWQRSRGPQSQHPWSWSEDDRLTSLNPEMPEWLGFVKHLENSPRPIIPVHQELCDAGYDEPERARIIECHTWLDAQWCKVNGVNPETGEPEVINGGEREADERFERREPPPRMRELLEILQEGFELLRKMSGHGKTPGYVAWERKLEEITKRIEACEG